ncbi:MAG: AAC(3) family N-acetyltransferase [Clostridia bacterium]|nr:AAC(3) family N-acetyltransferase [Clostridia bacterium]MBR4799222.1 AAC(3) family N-acetyltransferase [Clostridia bacterium]
MNEKSRIISEGALALGVAPGDTLMVHSSLKSLGEGFTPADVIEGLTCALGKEGTLMLPALSYLTCNAKHPEFDYYATKSNVGAIPEYFRTSVPGVLRSVNPTHSCCALGKNAEYLTSGHILDETPCGENSPFRRLMQLGGKILFLGCGMNPNTSMHAVEELVVPDYLFGDTVEYRASDAQGNIHTLRCRAHNFKGVAQCYYRLASLLGGDELRRGFIANAECVLVQTVPMWRKAEAAYRKNPHYFIDFTE